jgi:hypothetical protein
MSSEEIEIDKPFDILLQIIHKKDEDFTFSEYIHSLLYHRTRETIEIITWIQKNLNKYIDSIIMEILKYIQQRQDEDKIFCQMFDMCCQLDLERTKQYFISGNFMYDKIIEFYQVKKELEKYQSKYESLKYYMENMSNGLLYYEMNDDYQRYINQMR